MGPEKAFKIWWGIRLHLTDLNYSMLSYGINTKNAANKYAASSDAQKAKFEWMGFRFPKTQDMVFASLGLELAGVDPRFDTKADILTAASKYIGRREGISHFLKKEVDKYFLTTTGEFNPVLTMVKYANGDYSPEFILLLDHELSFLDSCYNSPTLIWCRDKLTNLIKYKSFFPVKNYLNFLEEYHVKA